MTADCQRTGSLTVKRRMKGGKSRLMTEIFQKLSSKIVWQDERNVLFGGDSLALLSEIPDRTVDLIVTDPPYHTTKKQNIIGDTDFDDDEAYLEWMRRYVTEWSRILKPTGSLYCFCSCRMASRLEVMMRESMTVLTNITWTKPNAPGFDGWKWSPAALSRTGRRDVTSPVKSNI